MSRKLKNYFENSYTVEVYIRVYLTMSRHFLPQCLLLFLLVHPEATYCKIHYIRPSLDSLCPRKSSSCITLSQFTANHSTDERDTSSYLLFLPGNHTLNQELFLAHGHNFSMTNYMHQDKVNIFIECTSQLGRFIITSAISVSIKGLNFINCSSNKVSQVTILTIADITFQGVESKGSVLVFNEVDTANIVRSQFHYNSLACCNRSTTLPFDGDEVLEYIYHRQNTTTGSAVLYTAFSNVTINGSNFIHNEADVGGALVAHNSSLHIDRSIFSDNIANFGGVMVTSGSTIDIVNSILKNNLARGSGGVMVTYNDRLKICDTTFTENIADIFAGVILTFGYVSFTISSSNFISNSAGYDGGVMNLYHDSVFNVIDSTFTFNTGAYGGVMHIQGESLFTINNSSFTFNHATYDGGVVRLVGNSLFIISNSNFISNDASYNGGVMAIDLDGTLFISNSTFTSNFAYNGGVIGTTLGSSIIISNSIFNFNAATNHGGVIQIYTEVFINISNSTFINNSRIASMAGAVIYCVAGTVCIDNSNFVSNNNYFEVSLISMIRCLTHIANTTFDHNVGSIYTVNSNLTFSGYSKFANSPYSLSDSISQGGGITSFQSTILLTRGSNTIFSNNQAKDGGAISATESSILMYGETTIIANNKNSIVNTTSNIRGGGIYLKQSRIEIKGVCYLINNSAVRGGGIYASGSTVTVYQPGTLHVLENNAKYGGGMYLEVNSKLYVLKTTALYFKPEYFLNFIGNCATYGGALYVADYTNSGVCSAQNECFIQTIALYDTTKPNVNLVNIHILKNNATKQGSILFGGLLDRCIPNPFAELYEVYRGFSANGVAYLNFISELGMFLALYNSISSQPVRLCFCNSENELHVDCNYQLPTVRVKKGEAFKVSIVAVDQVNNAVKANITTFISSSDAGLGEGQQSQTVGRICTDLVFNVFSPHVFESLTLFADGPCGSAALSTRYVIIQFTDCTCPVGFEPLSSSETLTRCECVCDSKLSPFITDCVNATGSVFRVATNSWITYINYTNQSGYVKYSNCPFDYCQPLATNISINFNLPNGADAQCAYNRTGVLCGSCRESSSLSLASSRCLPCHSHWPAVCVVILLAAILAGILLVAGLLALNMTVSVGLINGFIFYANIVSAGDAVFFPSSEPSFPSVFIAWLNLDIGIDVCFFDGLDAYIKTWLKLAFPMYIISLVVIVIKTSEYSPRFARLISRRDPISTLATLVLLSYAKLLSVTITALSFARLDYPNGEQETVWLADGNVKYFQGKHIPLALVALLIILIGLPYTIFLFLWQWIIRCSRWKIFNCTRNTKLHGFIETYHVPHRSEYRFWTGLLLLVRVVFYVTASVTVSANPQTLPLLSAILIGALIFSSKIFSLRVYKNSLVDVVDTVLCFNLVALALFTLYDFKFNVLKQTSVAYTSTILTLLLFVGSLCYHVSLLIKKKKAPQVLNEILIVPVQPAKVEVTSSVIDIPKPDQQ